jgi:hypothetical protein
MPNEDASGQPSASITVDGESARLDFTNPAAKRLVFRVELNGVLSVNRSVTAETAELELRLPFTPWRIAVSCGDALLTEQEHPDWPEAAALAGAIAEDVADRLAASGVLRDSDVAELVGVSPDADRGARPSANGKAVHDAAAQIILHQMGAPLRARLLEQGRTRSLGRLIVQTTIAAIAAVAPKET